MLMVKEILGYFLIAMVVMLILIVCYLPFGLILRRKVPLLRQIPYFMLGVCLFVISAATFLGWIMLDLLEGEKIFAVEHSLNLIPFHFLTEAWAMGARKQFTQCIANIFMFFPMGFIFPIAFKKMRTFWKTTGCMMLFSFFIEFVQYFIGRAADVDDLMLNTLGGTLGYFLFFECAKLWKNNKLWKKINGTISREKR